MEDLNEIHWHDSEVESVIEIPAKDELVYNVQYPEDWNKNTFAPKAITFSGYHTRTSLKKCRSRATQPYWLFR